MQKPTKSIELKIVPIGNSRGVRLPKEILEGYAIKETLVLEPRDEGLLLPRKADLSLS